MDEKILSKIIGSSETAMVSEALLSLPRFGKYDLTEYEKRHGFVLLITERRQIIRAEMMLQDDKWVPTGNVNISIY